MWDSINRVELPLHHQELFGSCWNDAEGHFTVQETFIIDYKDKCPKKFNDSFGSSIVRLSLAFYNCFGGLIVFGVQDRTLDLLGVSDSFDIETFNSVLTDVSGLRIECLARDYWLTPDKRVSVLLVPKRGMTKPARLLKGIGGYPAGALWVRDRHEATEATSAHLSMLHSSRSILPSDVAEIGSGSIYRSLPPSPATMQKFVGRETLLATLWDWLIFGDHPRIYLHGPGGSGKSTLAFEFARLVADYGHDLAFPGEGGLDYVLYISGKESELNPFSGKQQEFTQRQFNDAESQFAQILVQSGQYAPDELMGDSEGTLLDKTKELFNTYNGLIVIDDIDALSRANVDTGEEPLLMQALLGARRTRILYTLRSAPPHALRSAVKVPGLEAGKEFVDFLHSCCAQFEVPPPEQKQFDTIARETSSLPLLIETVVGLRRVSSTFREAIAQFKERGDDDARRYLYQREYDRLLRDGKSREILAAFSHLKEPLGVTSIANLLGIPNRAVTDAISECGSIFLIAHDNQQGETLFQLAAPSRPFIRNVSKRLNRADQIQRRVELFQQQGAYTPEESSLIVRMERMARAGKMADIVSLAQSIAPEDPVLANPKVLSLTGQAYSYLGPNFFEKARECFRAAEAMGFRDIYAMRAWYLMEFNTGYGAGEAARLCNSVIESDGISSAYKSEFWAKLGRCHYSEGVALIGVSREKGFRQLRQSIEAYLEALWVGRNSRDLNAREYLTWMERPLHTMLLHLGDQVDEYMELIGCLPEKRHDITLDAAIQLLQILRRVRTPADTRARAKMAGLCKRASQRLDRFVKDSDSYPGFSYLIEKLDVFQRTLAPDA